MGNRLKFEGKRFGRLTVIEFAYIKNHLSYWRCVCDCGKESVVAGGFLTSGNTKSCGCFRWDRLREVVKKHDGRGTRLYRIWRNMKSRCTQPKMTQFKDYGGRGVRVCPEWENDFCEFQKWAIANNYSDDLTIDRIDVNGNYCPENCRWVTRKEQARNKRSNHIVNGKTVAEWAESLNVNYNTLLCRFNRLPFEEAVRPYLLKHGNT